MSDVSLLGDQLVLEQKRFWRNPTSAIFTFLFPIMFLVIFRAAQLQRPDHGSRQHPFRAVLRTVDRRVQHLLFVLRQPRDCDAVPPRDGLSKRARTTPSARPPSSRLIVSTLIIGAVLSIIITATGVVFYGVHFYSARLAALLVTSSAVASSSCCALGLAVATVVPNADAAPAIVNFVYFPIVFISGTFFPVRQSSVLAHIAILFPVPTRDPRGVRGVRSISIGLRIRMGPPRGDRGMGCRRPRHRDPTLPLGTVSLAVLTTDVVDGIRL